MFGMQLYTKLYPHLGLVEDLFPLPSVHMTHCHIVIAPPPQDAKRFLDAKELLSSQLLPVTLEQSRLSRAPPLCLNWVVRLP